MLFRGVCTIEAGLWARNTHLGDVCSSIAHDSAPSEEQAVCQWSIGHRRCFVLLAQSIQVIFRIVCTMDAGLWARNTHLGDVCTSIAHDSSPSEEQVVCQWSIDHRRQLTALRALNTIDSSAIARCVHNGRRALGSQHTPWRCLQLQSTRFSSK